MSPIVSVAVSALVGAIASLVANAIWHQMTSPRVVVHQPERSSVQGNAHFWGASVTMADALLVGRYPALAVQARLEVRDPDSGKPIAGFTCRWQGTPQPVIATGANQYVRRLPLFQLASVAMSMSTSPKRSTYS